MHEISVAVRSKIAKAQENPVIVCGNSNYLITFDLDAEWSDAENLTASFQYVRNGERVTEVIPLTDRQCRLPVLRGTWEVLVGVSGGNIRTAAPAVIPCMPCITDLGGTKKQPVRDIYNEIMEVVGNA